MNSSNKNSKAKRNYFVDIAALVPMLILIFTGIIMLAYHAGQPYSEKILGLDGHIWLALHVWSAVLSFLIILLHLFLHATWFKKLFTGQLKNKHWIKNLLLVVLFLLASITAFLPWLFLGESGTASKMLGIHNKIGLLMIIFIIIHLFNYTGWMLKMTKRIFVKNK